MSYVVYLQITIVKELGRLATNEERFVLTPKPQALALPRLITSFLNNKSAWF